MKTVARSKEEMGEKKLRIQWKEKEREGKNGRENVSLSRREQEKERVWRCKKEIMRDKEKRIKRDIYEDETGGWGQFRVE